MLGWDRCCFHKKPSEIYYAKLVFLHRWDLLVT
jgi:hypothetical protein